MAGFLEAILSRSYYLCRRETSLTETHLYCTAESVGDVPTVHRDKDTMSAMLV